ncbi:calcium-activated chloride channel regulator 1-like [Mercenaria mercenaria]|uniref:calcium-activated chloride channel regulator 1-like n=1 Tax=Mercenaria mercenaria TaxID=6596 RepID=UPI00234F3CA7|nr:calcium-activated chloride channel regulator 1-like [Mercenaria mercenaria]
MFCVRVIFLFLLLWETTSIILKNGGYEEVYVIVHDSNNESDILLRRIQDILTSASKLLFTATHNQVYFRKINIIVPVSWSSKPEYKKLPASPIKESYFSVDENGFPTPQVRGQFICGKGGHYMHLSPKFLLQKRRSSWGLHDRVIVHEWGHLRWGLYNELPMGEKFYQAGGKWNPVRCTDSVDGKIGLRGGCLPASNKCNTNDTSKKMNKECSFCPDPYQDVDASLMGNQWINALSQFCDKDDPTVKKEHRHNKLAPTKQNKQCNYKSAWEVMREHKDFQTAVKLPASTSTTPEFKIIQETTSYRVFVLDISGSMQGTRIATLQQTVQYIIEQLISKGSWLGIVSFSSGTTVEKYMTEVNTQADRDNLRQAIPTNAKGGTCIGCGLSEATQVLKRHLGNAENGEIILISDGMNNENDVVDINAARREVVAEKIVVHTIAVSQQADTLLSDIAKETGGQYYTYLDKGSISLVGAFSQAISGGLTSTAHQNVMLLSEKRDSVNSTVNRLRFSIDDSLGKDTSFTFMTHTDNNIQLQLNGPNNYSQLFESQGKIATLSIPGIAQAGEYEMTITTDTTPQTVEYHAKSVRTSNDIIKVTSMLSTNDIDFSSGELPIIFADVTKGYLPILNATVSARVETGSKSCDVHLKDDGVDPDAFVNDGIYSGYIFPKCLDSGRVNVKVNVKGSRGETMILKSVTGASSPDEVDEEPKIYNSSFQRVEFLEELYVTNYEDTGSSDVIAPGRITDVALYHIRTESLTRGESRNFTITWTATGDDKSIGQAFFSPINSSALLRNGDIIILDCQSESMCMTLCIHNTLFSLLYIAASSYILGISDDFETLLNEFDSAEQLEMRNVSLIPQEAGETEALKIVVDAEKVYTETAYFAIKAVDEAGNKGEVSNIISIVVARGYRVAGEEGSLAIEDDKVEATSFAVYNCGMKILIIVQLCLHLILGLY